MPKILLTGARVLAPDALSTSFQEVLVEDGRIAALLPPGTKVESAQTHDASHRLIIPGLVNGHSHGHGGLAKGSGDKWDLALLLAHAPWVTGGRLLQDKYLSSALNAVENLKKGCTAVYDLPSEIPLPTAEGLDAMAEAYAAVGIRAVLAPMLGDLTFFQATPGLIESLPEPFRSKVEAMSAAPAAQTLGAMDAIARGWSHGSRNIRFGVAPTIPLHGTDDFLKACRALAAEHGLPMQSHVAESRYQAAGGAIRYEGATLLGHMDKLGLVGPWFSVAHGVWLTEEDLALLAERGAGISHNPGANMRLASGIAPVRKAIAAGVTVGIGTDGSSSSDNQNMFEAMRLAAFASRLWEDAEDDDWLGTAETVRLATQGSSRLMGLSGGTIEVGQNADLVLLDLTHVNWAPLNDAANQMVWTEDGSAVADVMVAGQWKLRDRKVLGIDEAKLAAAANEAAERLRGVNAEARKWCEAVAPHVACHCRAMAKGWTRSKRLLKAE
ncbi:amidohydrolase family protein [Falsiroseomonas tokyonensis]|uniref:Amidohydrolase family protein n=1 Tax=Falsiroseomonas tokyonensis TaxID=430521 RepID=A0ABV7BU60_9PROT|nr:amidohydrolase family protein [Falsiroseomonas tokyonensis]MBU8537983.1 amidohydrolase family protein [Falsiroseomonas tokyonensis]